jgi:hypothetical protein
MTNEPFDMEAEIAAIRERMAQPLSQEQIAANELWAPIETDTGQAEFVSRLEVPGRRLFFGHKVECKSHRLRVLARQRHGRSGRCNEVGLAGRRRRRFLD